MAYGWNKEARAAERVLILKSHLLAEVCVQRTGDLGRPLTASSVPLKALGNSLPLASALLSIPAHALGLKKNRCGTLCASSNMSNKEDSFPSLGNAEVLSVQHSVGEPIPEFCQRPENGTKVSPSS
jgi:hypothetical protein